MAEMYHELDITLEETLTAFSLLKANDQRLLALEIIINLLAKEEHHDFSESLAADVFTTLLNFLSNDILTEKRAALKRKLLDTCLIGLSNASKTTANVEKLLNIANIESGESVMVSCIDNFLAYNPQLEMEDDEEDDDEWRHMGNVICNICQVERGRRFFLQMNKPYIQRLAAQIRSKWLDRRRAAVGAIRSCLWEPDFHWWLVNDIQIVTSICLPLVVFSPFVDKDKEGMDPTLWLAAENSTKQREQDLDILKMLVECLVLLSQKRILRNELRKRKVYPILRNLDLTVDDEPVSLAILDAVNFLIGDEDPNETD